MKITLTPGDITGQDADAIVNAANSTLLGGGGVDGAIHARGGPEIMRACRKIRKMNYPQGLPAGRAVITTGGRLRADWVIHTVGPRWSVTEDKSDILASCYTESLKLASQAGLGIVAFPVIGAGVYGWPADEAAAVALQAVRSSSWRVAEVRFILFTEEMQEAFAHAASA